MTIQIEPFTPPILGYVTPLSAAPGEALSFRISSTGDLAFTARVVRIHCADPNPAGPGMKMEVVQAPLPQSYPGKEQPVHAGACALASINMPEHLKTLELRLAARPTLVSDALQVLASLQDELGARGVAIALQGGRLVLLPLAGDTAPVATGIDMRADRWQLVALQYDIPSGSLELSVDTVNVALPGWEARIEPRTVRVDLRVVLAGFVPAVLCVGALWEGHPRRGFNGMVEAPSVLARLSDGATATVPEQAITLAAWDLAECMMEQTIPGTEVGMPALTLVNVPTRAVRSSAWSGRVLDWRTAPTEYAAIYFHADALSDCKWDESLAFTVPDNLPSGVYGLEVTNANGTDTIPFYVKPAPNAPRARIVFLAPTLTYQAYANHARGNFAGELAARAQQWGAYPHNPDAYPQYGASTYNRYADGAGIGLSSRLRPMLTMRPGFLTFHDQNGSGLRHFPADSHLTDWLREKGFVYDVITDEDLDDGGVAVLAPYDVVVTGSHPEYHTRRTIEALIQYREQGGYLMYMGANGFYWKVARSASLPHMMEIRRAEGGIRAWASEPGEYYHQLDGEYGGMWRRNGIAPQRTGGVGFAVQGSFEGRGYRRTAESYGAVASWLFEGVQNEAFGDFGLSGGGAAGFELDQAEPALGTPGYMKIVAVSEGHGPSFRTVPEEILTYTLAVGVQRRYDGVRAHMAVGEAEDGGGLFAVGSITFLGSLSYENYNNDVSRVVENCLRRFLSTSEGNVSVKPNLQNK